MPNPKIGDVVEIRTKKGLAYAHYTHHHKTHGALLRILPGFHEIRPGGFEDIVKQTPVFMTFFPLGAALRRKLVGIAGTVPVPREAQAFPVFRAANGAGQEWANNWWLWDGKREWYVGTLTPEQRRLSIASVWNDSLLIERIESGWTPETDKWSQ